VGKEFYKIADFFFRKLFTVPAASGAVSAQKGRTFVPFIVEIPPLL
jgi:hypothetical protein